MSAYVAQAAAAVKLAMPPMSTLPRAGVWASASVVAHSTMAMALTGRLTKKIQRHDAPSVSSPPRIGPTAAEAPATAPQIP
ncbi:MAG: hypothetical protein JWN52_7021 [Actinomycetia bacterium]|nr:hypothetical protein [Actinomycetes bacterium]